MYGSKIFNIQYSIFIAQEYEKWFKDQSARSIIQIENRLSKIKWHGHFGDHKYLDSNIWELRWKNGRRIYYAYIPKKRILLILGGNKNGQSKDITKAKKILKRETEPEV